MQRKRVRSAWFVSVFAAACRLLDPQACTTAGCAGGLFIEFDSRPTAPVRIEVTVPSESHIPLVAECANGLACDNGVLFPSFYPGTIRLKVTHGSASSEREVAPYYAIVQPNGPDCSPTCRIATIRVVLPR